MIDMKKVFIEEASRLFGRDLGNAQSVQERRFRSLFDVSPRVADRLWMHLMTNLPHNTKPHHILWALLFLKSYSNEVVLSAITGADEKTQRLWIWKIVRLISELRVVSWRHKLCSIALTSEDQMELSQNWNIMAKLLDQR